MSYDHGNHNDREMMSEIRINSTPECFKCGWKMWYVDGWVFIEGKGWICDNCGEEEEEE